MFEHILSQGLVNAKWFKSEHFSHSYGEIVISLNFIGLDMTYNHQIPYMDTNNYHIRKSGGK